jgi:hypothetical protein
MRDAINHQVAEEPVQGRDAIRRMFADAFAATEDGLPRGESLRGRRLGHARMARPQGPAGCGYFHVRDDRIVFQRGYWDKVTFLRQQGLPLPKE